MNDRIEQDDAFLDSLRAPAAALRYEPEDPFVFTRIRAGVAGRTRQQPLSVLDLLFAWRRRVVTLLVAATLVSALSLAAVWRTSSSDTLDASADAPLISEDFYRVAAY